MSVINKEFIKELNCEMYSNKIEKFKSSLIQVSYYFHKDEVDVNSLTLLSNLLLNGCKDYPSTVALSSYLEDLYGSAISPKIEVNGDLITFSVIAGFISDYYSEENLSDKVVELVSKLIYDPNFKNKKFEKEYFEFQKAKFVSSRKKFTETKENYSFMRFNALLEKEYNVKTSISSIKDDSKIAINDVMKAYEVLLQAPYTIFVAGDLDIEKTKNIFIKHLHKSGENKEIKFVTELHNPIKSKIEKSDKFSQSFVIALFDVDTNSLDDRKDFYAASVYSAYLHDRYFDVIREKHGLCYAVANTYLPRLGCFRMLAGIDASKYRKTISLANKEIDKIKNGKISKKHWNKTIELLTGAQLNGKDDISNYISALVSYKMFGYYNTTEENIELINNVKQEDVIAIARKTKPLTTFLLKGMASVGGENNE